MENESYNRYAKIRDLRELTDYKVSILADLKGTATISNWKNGKYIPKDDKMQKIADLLNVSVEYLMTGKEKEFDRYSPENAKVVSKVMRDEQALRIMEYFIRLNKLDRDEIENMIKYKVNKKRVD